MCDTCETQGASLIDGLIPLDAPYTLPVDDFRFRLQDGRLVEMREGQAWIDDKPVIIVPDPRTGHDVAYELERPHTLLVKIDPLPDWYAKHTQEGGPIEQEGIDWIRSRPESIRTLMLLFPPSCVVRATVKLDQPRPWELGVVSSYIEPDQAHSEGLVTVHVPGSLRNYRSECGPLWLKVVGYWNGLTPDRVAEILRRKR